MKKKELYRNSIQISNLWEEKVRISIILVIVRIGRNIQPSLLHAVTFAYSPNTQNKEFCGFCFCYYCLREYVNFQSLLKWSRCQNSPFFETPKKNMCIQKDSHSVFGRRKNALKTKTESKQKNSTHANQFCFSFKSFHSAWKLSKMSHLHFYGPHKDPLLWWHWF